MLSLRVEECRHRGRDVAELSGGDAAAILAEVSDVDQDVNVETLGIVLVSRPRVRDSQSWYQVSNFFSLGLRFGIESKLNKSQSKILYRNLTKTSLGLRFCIIIGIKQVLVFVYYEILWSYN